MRNDDSASQPLSEEGGTAFDDDGPASERRFWRWTTLGVGALAFGKAMRLPNPWSYAQAQLNYSTGFMRRGLFGSLLGHTLRLNLYLHFAVVSTALLLLLYGALALLARGSRLADRMPPGELLAVYASSYSVTYLAHLNGYLDIPLALLCIGPLFVRRTGWRLLAAVVATVAGVLIHEQFFFAFVPLLVVSVAFGAATAKTSAQTKGAWAGAILLAILGVSLTWYMGRHATISAAQTQLLAQSAARITDRPLDTGVFDVLPRTPRENLQIMESVWRRPTFIPAQIESLLIFAPTAALLSWATLLVLRRWRPDNYRWLYAGTLLAMLAPLSLHLVGWDKNRWNQLLCLNALLMLLFVSRTFGVETVRLPLWMRRACLLVMLLNMATGGGLLDGRHVRPFPFMRSSDATVAKVPAARDGEG